MLSVSIKTGYSEEHFMIPDWQPEVQEYAARMELDEGELTARASWPEWRL